jgi:peptidoglycan hydrolase-like protein with peptidoglycan-binding domain
MKRLMTMLLVVLLLLTAAPALGETVSATSAFTGTPEELLQQWYQLSALLKENGAYPFVELKKGDAGYEVTALQTRLKELGYYQKEIVDKFGSGTYSALRSFERANGLTVDGEASVADQQALFSSNAVKYAGGTSSGNSSSGGSSSNNSGDATSGATK